MKLFWATEVDKMNYENNNKQVQVSCYFLLIILCVLKINSNLLKYCFIYFITFLLNLYKFNIFCNI